jgi:hypothetical protein
MTQVTSFLGGSSKTPAIEVSFTIGLWTKKVVRVKFTGINK